MTTRHELEQLAKTINIALGLEVDPDKQYFVQWAYGQPRLMRAGGSVEVSPRLPSGQLAQWMRAFYAGVWAGRP
jgi:hypothetical protein